MFQGSSSKNFMCQPSLSKQNENQANQGNQANQANQAIQALRKK